MNRGLSGTARALGRAALFCLSALVAGGVTARLASGAIARAEPVRAAISLDLLPLLAQVRATLTRNPAAERVLLVGDSVLQQSVPLPVGTVVTSALRRARGARSPVAVGTLSWPGWSVSSEYCVVDDLLAMNPDRVVLEVNPRSLGARNLSVYGYPELSGHLSPEHYPEALGLTLAPAGITWNRLLFHRLIHVAGLDSLFFSALDAQAKAYEGRAMIERAVEHALGASTYDFRRFAVGLDDINQLLVPGKNRESARHALAASESLFHGVDTSYPPLRTLGKVVRRLASNNQHPLVWIAPMNLDHLRTLGLDLSGLDQSLAAIRKVVEDAGGTVADFHSLLRDVEFGDSGDHPSCDGERPGAEILGRHLARAILDSERGR